MKVSLFDFVMLSIVTILALRAFGLVRSEVMVANLPLLVSASVTIFSLAYLAILLHPEVSRLEERIEALEKKGR